LPSITRRLDILKKKRRFVSSFHFFIIPENFDAPSTKSSNELVSIFVVAKSSLLVS